jgi:hypothetical protein
MQVSEGVEFDVPRPALLDFGHVELEEAVEPGKKFLSVHLLSIGYMLETRLLFTLIHP